MQKKIKKPAKVPVHHAPPPNQVRIIGGQWKRSVLPVLQALGLRPTPDRVRETVFNWINHLRDGDWTNAQVLDLFAGSGALGLEALSRGAREAMLVERDARLAESLRQAVARLRAEGEARVVAVAPRAGIGEGRQTQRQRVRTHVPAVGEHRHGVEPPAAADFHHHHHQGQHGGAQRVLLRHGVAFAERVAVAACLGEGIQGHGGSLLLYPLRV